MFIFLLFDFLSFVFIVAVYFWFQYFCFICFSFSCFIVAFCLLFFVFVVRCIFVSSFIHLFFTFGLLMHCYRFVVLPQPVCLERGVSYKLRVEFIRYADRNSIITLTNAFVLVDSVSIDL